MIPHLNDYLLINISYLSFKSQIYLTKNRSFDPKVDHLFLFFMEIKRRLELISYFIKLILSTAKQLELDLVSFSSLTAKPWSTTPELPWWQNCHNGSLGNSENWHHLAQWSQIFRLTLYKRLPFYQEHITWSIEATQKVKYPHLFHYWDLDDWLSDELLWRNQWLALVIVQMSQLWWTSS